MAIIGKQSAPNYVIRYKAINDSNKKITDLFNEVVIDALDDQNVINNLDDITEHVTPIIRDMIDYIVAEHEQLKVINYKVVSNENNNPDPTKLPLVIDVHYRHKDSNAATILHYKLEKPAPAAPKVDRFLIWKKKK